MKYGIWDGVNFLVDENNKILLFNSKCEAWDFCDENMFCFYTVREV